MTVMTLAMTYIGHYPEVISPSFYQKVPYTNSVSSVYVGMFNPSCINGKVMLG